MEIKITTGTGSGKTELAAFDAALNDAGIANYNIIRLSSVIPPNTKIVEVEKIDRKDDEYGHRLYVVMAENYCSKAGESVFSGIGWVFNDDNSGKGLFVEHQGKTEEEVRGYIESSFSSMAEYRPEERGEINYKIKGVTCDGEPVCSLVVAVYKSEGWI